VRPPGPTHHKIAWEAPRFWETKFNIYGGISWLTSGPVGLVWYPSGRLFSETGVVLSGYGREGSTEFGRLPDVQAKLGASRKAVEKLHPGYGEQLRNPIYVGWGKTPHNLGSWVRGFSRGDDRFYFAGDHCSHLNAWMEGAALWAHRAIRLIHERVRAGNLTGPSRKSAASV
jgi:monoamine oxidase